MSEHAQPTCGDMAKTSQVSRHQADRLSNHERALVEVLDFQSGEATRCELPAHIDHTIVDAACTAVDEGQRGS